MPNSSTKRGSRTVREPAKPDRVTQLRKVASVVTLLEQARDDAKDSHMEDVEMIVQSALNLVFSTYYLNLRGEYLDKPDV